MTDCILFKHATVYTISGPWPDAWLLVEGGRINSLGTGEYPGRHADRIIDLAGRDLLPGFIDMHVHGALGHDTMEPEPQALRTMAHFFGQHGVTSFLASTISAAPDAIAASLKAIQQAACERLDGAQVLGAHLEGPFIEPTRRGAHEAAQIRVAQVDEYRTYLRSGIIKMLTLAPEFSENLALLRDAAKQGIVIALGHSRASYEQVCQAVALGATQVTHLFNAMEPLHHRQPGMVGAALTIPALCCEVIADLVHLAAPILRLVWAAKGANGIVLVTDAMSGTGMADGEYHLWGDHITVVNGEARTPAGALAGSTLTLDRALVNMMRTCHLSLAQALPMVTANPARQLGIRTKGIISAGCDADLVVWDHGEVLLTMAGGEIIHTAAGLQAL